MATPMILPPSVLQRTSDMPSFIREARAVGLGTISRKYDVTPAVARALVTHHQLRITIITVEAVRGQPHTDRPYVVVYASRERPSRVDAELGHLAGLAEMRLLTGDREGRWVHARAAGQAVPDAYWHVPAAHPLRATLGMEALIEFDRGTYAPATRTAKIEAALLSRRPLIYGCPIPRRLLLVRDEASVLDARHRAQGRISSVARPLPVLLWPTFWHVGSEL